jgi:uncharacterized iron-regulated membrane protein
MRRLAGYAIPVALLIFVFCASEPALAQCAMCLKALEQGGGQLAGGFNRAILFLLAMPYLVFTSVALSWYWKRRKRALSAPAPSPAKESLA